MSADALPITPARFAAALPDLSLASLYAKAAELRNSIAHLQSSNSQLEPFAIDGDVDCYEAIQENKVVIERMLERIELLKREVEERGVRWVEPGEGNKEEDVNGTAEGGDRAAEGREGGETRADGAGGAREREQRQNGESQQREEDDGVFL
ncbi:hypothetical protein M501DRAFT_1013577 [Patellaria atrata CBS 101060]|uniref:Uncharacterized protein n=1 Tax=Patellaria atrata CBS 101060 TaxID=1346257 RepID=A0A9P4SGS1_9PEZI|nr:hypothetical protein M501DRAFT_1013577 [Patellaria atrata CBS 101060]